MFISINVKAQNIGISDEVRTADPSSVLDVYSVSRGLLIPRMTQAERNAINAPAASLLIYQTDVAPGYYYNSGTSNAPSWTQLTTSATSGWSTTGNSGTDPNVNFIGTTDTRDFVIRTDNTEWLRVYADGTVGIRTNVADDSKSPFTMTDDDDNIKFFIRSDGRIGINQSYAGSGSIDCYSNGPDAGFRLTNDGTCNSYRMWLADASNSNGSGVMAYLGRGGMANTGICIDDNCDDYSEHYGAVGICLDPNAGDNLTDPPSSTLQVNGSFSARVNEISDDYTLTNRDYFAKVNTGGADKTLTLPSASTCSGRTYIIKKTDPDGGEIIIIPDGSETVDGDSQVNIAGQYSSITIISDGSNWFITSRYNY